MEQLAKQMPEHESGSFSATTEVKLRGQCKAVTTRRGTVVGLKDESEFSENKTNEEDSVRQLQLEGGQWLV